MTAATTTVPQFRSRATIAIEDIRLQGALEGATGHFRDGHDGALATLPYSNEMRDHLKAIRSTTLANLAWHLETFERQAILAGACVHWARDAEEASRIVVEQGRPVAVETTHGESFPAEVVIAG